MSEQSSREHPGSSLATGQEHEPREVGAGHELWRGWLREVVLCVPDPENAASYYADLLGGRARGQTVELGSSTRLELRLGAPGLFSASFDMLDAASAELRAMGEPLKGEQHGYALTDPDGRSFRMRCVPELEERSETREARLGHLTFETPDPLRQEAFFARLGFQLSEGLGANFRWLRCNPIHHSLAFSRGSVPALHHLAIEVPDRSALIDVCDRLARLDHLVQYGPGRHFVGNNLFIYALDRYGIRFEFFCELQRITTPDWQPRIHEAVDRRRSINLWGPQPPAEYWKGL